FYPLEIRARQSLAPPFMVPMRAKNGVGALHELASALVQSFVAYATKVRRDGSWFRCAKCEVVEAAHEAPLFGDPEGVGTPLTLPSMAGREMTLLACRLRGNPTGTSIQL